MSGFEDEWSSTDDVFTSVSDEYAIDPAGVTTRLIEEASRDQFERLQPAIDTVIQGHRQRLWETNTAQAVKAMDDLYGETWRRYEDDVQSFVQSNPDMFDAVANDPQKLAERLQAAYRTVKPMVDAKQSEGEWERIQGSYHEYGDSIGKS